jgi:hypothetical protein
MSQCQSHVFTTSSHLFVFFKICLSSFALVTSFIFCFAHCLPAVASRPCIISIIIQSLKLFGDQPCQGMHSLHHFCTDLCHSIKLILNSISFRSRSPQHATSSLWSAFSNPTWRPIRVCITFIVYAQICAFPSCWFSVHYCDFHYSRSPPRLITSQPQSALVIAVQSLLQVCTPLILPTHIYVTRTRSFTTQYCDFHHPRLSPRLMTSQPRSALHSEFTPGAYSINSIQKFLRC